MSSIFNDNPKKQKRVLILGLPKGGFLATNEEGGDWVICSEHIEKVLEWVREELSPPSPEVLTYAEAVARVTKPGVGL